MTRLLAIPLLLGPVVAAVYLAVTLSSRCAQPTPEVHDA